MAALLAIRTDFVNMSNRYDLINSGSYTSDNGADDFINKAQRFLDRSVYAPRTQRRYAKRLKTGDFFITLDELISIDAVFVKDASDSEKELTDITSNGFSYQSFRQEYSGAISSWSSGEPSAWAPAPILFSPELAFSEQLTNGTFTIGSGWTLTGNWALDGGTLNGTTDSGNVTQGAVLAVGRTYRITFTITKVSAGSVAVLCGTGTTGTSRSTAGTFTEDLVCATDTTFGFDGTGFTGSIDNVSAADITLQSAFIETAPIDIGDTLVELPDSVNSRMTGIIFNPTADAAYTIEVLGRFYTRAMSADTDTSYWSVNYPDLLVITASYLAVRQHGNAARTQYFLDLMQTDATSIAKETVEFEMSGMDTKLEVW
jgi:hypothetical protein